MVLEEIFSLKKHLGIKQYYISRLSKRMYLTPGLNAVEKNVTVYDIIFLTSNISNIKLSVTQ